MAEIYLHGIPGQSRKALILRREAGAVVVKNEYAESGESRYSTATGRALDVNGRPTSWDFWRLRL